MDGAVVGRLLSTPAGTFRAEAGIHIRAASLEILLGASADISFVTS